MARCEVELLRGGVEGLDAGFAADAPLINRGGKGRERGRESENGRPREMAVVHGEGGR